MKTLRLKKQRRFTEFGEIRALDDAGEDSRRMQMSFSSEKPVARYFGEEVLSHDEGAADLSRLNNGANVLFNHDWDAPIGVVERAWIGADRRGYVEFRFSKNEKAQEIYQDVKDGILRNVSFGYEIKEMLEERKDGKEVYRVTRWEPFEVSVVTVPADPGVGFGRAEESEEKEVTVFEEVIEQEITPAEGQLKGEKMEVDVKDIESKAVEAERSRIATIQALGEKFQMQELARELITSGKALDDARSAFLEKMGLRQKPVSKAEAEIGLSEKEAKSFSFQRAINAMANPQDKKAFEAASFEREISEAAQKATGRTARGYLIPVDVLRQKRDLVKGTPTAGGNLHDEQLLIASFIEILRNRSVLQRAGAQTLTGLVGDIAVPRQTGTATSYWVGEGVDLTESQQAFDQVKMSPKTCGGFVDYSRKLALQVNMDVEQMIRNDLAAVIALEIDRAGLYGSGAAGQPLGLVGLAGINTVNFAAAYPTYAELVSMETEVALDNADVGALAYLVNAQTRGVLKSTEKAVGTAQFVWEAGNTINGYRTEVSQQVRMVGADPDVWFGAWDNAIMGFWSGLDIMVDPYAGATAGNMRVIAMQDMDIMFRRPQYFAKGSNTP